MAVVVAMPTLVGLSNTDEAYRFGHMNEPGPWVSSFTGCDITPTQEPAELDNMRRVEEEYQNVKSAASDKNIWEQAKRIASTVIEFTGQSIEYSLYPETRFTMEQSGVEVVVYAPENITIDQEKFAELFHAPLKVEPASFEHQEVRQLMDCYRQAIIEEQKFSGELLRVYVAPDGGYCIDEGRFVPTSATEECLGHGFTPPLVDFDAAGITVAEYRFMMLSTSSTGSAANQTISRSIIHEGFHALSNLMEKEPFLLNPDEQLTKYIEGVTLAKLYPEDVPEAITYP